MIRITRQGSTDTVNPDFVEALTEGQAGRNAFYELLDGEQAVVLQTASWRTGVLRLMWGGRPGTAAAARTAAIAAQAIHARRGVFRYVDDQAGTQTDFLYALDGIMQRYPSDSRATWRLDVPFRMI